MTRKNTRPLAHIAADIHDLGRNNIFAEGDLFIEAQAACAAGDWLEWLNDEGFSHDTAMRKMKVAKLADRFRKLRNLKLAKTTLYALAEDADDPLMPTIIEALAKVATKAQLRPAEAEHAILVVRLRQEFGDDLPDATLFALDSVAGLPWAWVGKAATALKAKKPTSAEDAKKIIDDVRCAPAHDDASPETGNGDAGGDHGGDDGVGDRGDHGDHGDHGDEQDHVELELIEALRVVLHYAHRPAPKSVTGITSAELVLIETFTRVLQRACPRTRRTPAREGAAAHMN